MLLPKLFLTNFENVEGQSVKLEAIGHLDMTYVTTLNFIWQGMQKVAQEAPCDCSGSFSPLVLPTYNDLLKFYDEEW